MKKFLTEAAILIGTASIAQDTTSNPLQTSKALTFSGYIEAYYSYDFNTPIDNNRPGFLYSHNRHNEFTVNLAFLKGNYQGDRIRANLAIAVGTYMNANYAAEPGVLKNIYEANAGYKLSPNKNLWFDIGIMPSHIGFESATSKDCWALTRSIVAENSPYFESGGKLSYTFDDGKVLLSALALNGWQRIQRVPGNSMMSWGTQVLLKPSDKVILNYSTFFGTDKPDSVRLKRGYHNLYGIFQFSEKIGLTLGFDIGSEQVTKGSSDRNTWYTPVGILKFTPNHKWAIALRGEYFNDENGVIVSTGTPNGFKTTGVSANVDFMPIPNATLRMELRTLDSKDAIFVKDRSMKDISTAFTVSAALVF